MEEQLLEDDAESKSRMYVNPLTSPQPTTSESFSSMKHSDFALAFWMGMRLVHGRI